MVKLIISGLEFYFHTYNFFLCKSPSFFLILKHFLKVRFFENSRVFFGVLFFQNSDHFFQTQVCFFRTKFFIVLNNAHVIYLLTTIAVSKKMNMMALMIKMVFICFMLHVPLDSNY